MSKLQEVIELSEQLKRSTDELVNKVAEVGYAGAFGGGVDPFVFGIAVFVLACFVGYFVVWRVTPALHTPLMSVTNAISGVIVVGAIIALGSTKGVSIVSVVSFMAIVIASINIVGGFFVTWRMLEMFKR
jgi:NAD(P) transhydrogenase subunit alpha